MNQKYPLIDINIPINTSIYPLYNLNPIGLRTNLVESLTSYVTRLAYAHCITIQQLLIHSIVPLIHNNSKSFIMSANRYFSDSSCHINGTTNVAIAWSKTIEKLTGINNLDRLTMLFLKDILSTKDLLRSQKAWCSQCLSFWKDSNCTLYEPLLWSIQAITTCPVHQSDFDELCPRCYQQQPILKQHGQLGFCCFCGEWLASDSRPKHSANPSTETNRLWQADAISSLVQAGATMTDSLSRYQLLKSLRAQVHLQTKGNIALFARQVGMSHTVLRRILRGDRLITLPALLALSVSHHFSNCGHIACASDRPPELQRALR